MVTLIPAQNEHENGVMHATRRSVRVRASYALQVGTRGKGAAGDARTVEMCTATDLRWMLNELVVGRVDRKNRCSISDVDLSDSFGTCG